jgi:DNA-binding NarL/FixJ family response regulator
LHEILKESILNQQIKIIVVEDHFATLDGLVLGLSQEPDIEVVAHSAKANEGLELVEKFKPDVLVLDLHLPGSSNPNAMLQEFLRFATMEIIIFSAESRLAYIQEVLAMGVSAYLLKSERVSKIAETARRVMQGERGIVSQDLNAAYKKITPSEQEVLHMLGNGKKYQEIALERNTSLATARKQCEVLILKLGLENREQLITWAVKNGYGTNGAETGTLPKN